MSKKSEQDKQLKENREMIFNFFKIKNEKTKKIFLIIIPILFFLTGAITFSFPFIQLNTIFKLVLLIVWIISYFIFWFIYTIMNAIIEENKKIENFSERKETDIFSTLVLIITLFMTFLLMILNKSFNSNFDIFNVIYYLIIILAVIFLFIKYRYEGKRKFWQDIISPASIIFAVFIIYAGFYSHGISENALLETYAKVILISIGSLYLFIRAIMFIYKLIFNDIDVIPGRYIWGTIFIVIVTVLGIVIILNLPLEDDTISNLITIYASVLGGGLTLVGVLMEMKYQDITRREEKLLEYKPLFTIVNYRTTTKGENIKSFVIYHNKSYDVVSSSHYKLKENEKFYYINGVLLQNSDNSNFFLKTILIDGVKINNKEKVIVMKNDNIFIKNFGHILSFSNALPKIHIVLEDILGNNYSYEIVFEWYEKELIAIDAIEIKNQEVTND